MYVLDNLLCYRFVDQLLMCHFSQKVFEKRSSASYMRSPLA